MNVNNVLDTVKYRIAQSSPYLYQSFGMENPRIFDFFDIEEEVAGNFTADESGKVYEIIAEIPNIGVCYRWVDPEFRNTLYQDSIKRGVDPTVAWEDVKFTEVESEENILFKVHCICNRIYVNASENLVQELSDTTLLKLAKIAAENDITINSVITKMISGGI